MFAIIKALPFITTAITSLQDYFKERTLLKKLAKDEQYKVKEVRIRAKAREQIKKIEANTSISLKLIEQTASSFKDEFILLCAVALFIAACLPSLKEEIQLGFATLSTMPEFLQYIFSAVFLSSLGLQISKGFKKR